MGPAGRSEFVLSVHCACFFSPRRRRAAAGDVALVSGLLRRSNRRYCTTRAKPRPQRSHTSSLASPLHNSSSMSPTASESPIQRASAAAPESGEDAGSTNWCTLLSERINY